MSEQAQGLEKWLARKGKSREGGRIYLCPVGESVDADIAAKTLREASRNRDLVQSIDVVGNGFGHVRDRVAMPTTSEVLDQSLALVMVVGVRSGDILHGYRLLKEFSRLSQGPEYGWFLYGGSDRIDYGCLAQRVQAVTEHNLGVSWPLLGAIGGSARDLSHVLNRWSDFLDSIDSKKEGESSYEVV